MRTTKKETARFHVGDWVSFPYGTKNLIAQIAEIRGALGINRRFLYRIRVADDNGELDSFEMPEDEMEAVSAPDKDAIINYLKEGGLVEILRANLGGGRQHPKVWLTYTPRGGLTHTFLAERGVVGGTPVPFFALHEGRAVFSAKKEEVAAFLTSFGISRTEADVIIAAVGMAP
ncbi:MAG: hypothetical protein ACYC3I_11815 [Gemmataceae bacterium]